MKNGRDTGLNYWKLNYRGKFIRTLWMIPIGIIAIILLYIADAPIQITIILSVLIFVSTIVQLIYTYVKLKNESNSE
ncbi:hypothetical protein [Oceanobacillus damuensis]|uniref:hypothetical protein n=1 Tax=Oceanobacillus damuensis TaxID=937928 RepID=UPI00082CD24E|nr:hypothetical protein [Oceanobacillus damuensis]